MAYASASDIASLTKNLVGGASSFDTSTSPTLTQVNAWLTSGCAMIETVLGAAVTNDKALYGVAVEANALYGAWMAERSRTNARTTAEERTRADMLRRDFFDHLKWLQQYGLSRAGVAPTSLAYAGGISAADKESVLSDEDRVRPRFTRGHFRNREVSLDDTSAS